MLSQLAAANATRHPEMGGHMRAMETRQNWRDPQFSPNQGQGYHYWREFTFQRTLDWPTPRPRSHILILASSRPSHKSADNAETYYLAGLAMAEGMMQAMQS